MKTLSRERVEQVEAWIAGNGRALEIAAFACRFRGKPVSAFLSQLSQYQNPDGGFAHMLDPDLWNPLSTPAITGVALGFLSDVGCLSAQQPIVQSALRYLRNGDGLQNSRWQFTMPSNNDYAHAPWWAYHPKVDEAENLGLSASLAAHLLTLCQSDDPLCGIAQQIALDALDVLMNAQQCGEMGLGGFATLMQHWAQMDIPYSLQTVDDMLMTRSNAAIVRDPTQWLQYVPRPSSVISSPASPLYPGNEDAIRLELDWLIDTLPVSDVWPIHWNWAENARLYPHENELMQKWAKARLATENLLLLRRFGRLA